MSCIYIIPVQYAIIIMVSMVVMQHAINKPWVALICPFTGQQGLLHAINNKSQFDHSLAGNWGHM